MSCERVSAADSLELDPLAEEHLAGCFSCRERAAFATELAALGAGDPGGWAGRPAPEVDVEAALGRVLQLARARRARPAAALAAAVAAAAVVLIAALTAPLVLRLRLDGSGPAAPPALAASGESSLLFWTSASR